MVVLIKAAQFLLSLTILVVLHEMGHFLTARWFKCRVDKFYLFFDFLFPVPSLLKGSLFKFKRGDTEYGIGWFPMGGYVSIAGMVDENMNTEQLKQPAQPWEFRSKPAWQRLIILMGGIIVNTVLAVIIYSMVLAVWGRDYVPTKNLTYGIAVDSTGRNMGFESGDKIVAIDGKAISQFSGGWDIDNFNDIPLEILVSKNCKITVDRNGQNKDLNITSHMVKEVLDKRGGGGGFIEPRIPFVVDTAVRDSAGYKLGLKHGSRIVSINGEPCFFFDNLHDLLQKYKGKQGTIVYTVGKDTVVKTITMPVSGKLNVQNKNIDSFITVTHNSYSVLAAIPAGYKHTYYVLRSYIRQFRLIFNTEVKGYKHIGGFATMASALPPTWDWEAFWNYTAFLSIILAFMNLLPIPALDGGHVVFTLAEMITGRKPGLKFMEYAQMTGIFILLGLMLYANGNDIVHLLFK